MVLWDVFRRRPPGARAVSGPLVCLMWSECNGTGKQAWMTIAEVVRYGAVRGVTGKVFEDTASRGNERGRDDVPGFV